MNDLDRIFEALPPTGEVADRLGVSDRAIRAWRLKDRRGIPPKHWPALVEMGKERGISCLTFERLASAHASQSSEAA